MLCCVLGTLTGGLFGKRKKFFRFTSIVFPKKALIFRRFWQRIGNGLLFLGEKEVCEVFGALGDVSLGQVRVDVVHGFAVLPAADFHGDFFGDS